MSSAGGKIEVTENTLLKLLFRRGSNEERKNIKLAEGEPGYAIDTKRLFVGDGITVGASPVSQYLYFGTGHPYTWASEALVSDFAYDSIAGGIYKLDASPYSTESNWTLFSGPLATRVDNTTINLDTLTGTLSVGTVSASQLDEQLAGLGLEFNGTSLQTTAAQEFDSITTRDNDFLQLPNKLQFGSTGGATVYELPMFDGAANAPIITNGLGKLQFGSYPAISQYLVLSSQTIPVGTIVQYGSGGAFNNTTSSIPYGYFVCDGSTKDGTVYSALCAAIGQYYGGSGTNFSVPLITDSDYIYLIKYVDDFVYTPSTIDLTSSPLTAYDLTNDQVATSLTFPNSGITYTLGFATSSITSDFIAPSSIGFDKINAWSGMPLKIASVQTDALSSIPNNQTWVGINTLSAGIVRISPNSSYCRIQGVINIGTSSLTYTVGIRLVRWTDSNQTRIAFAIGKGTGNTEGVTVNAEGNNAYAYATVPIDCYDHNPPSDTILYYGVEVYSTISSTIFFNRSSQGSSDRYTQGVSSLTITEIKS